MRIAHVYIEHSHMQLNRTFTYCCDGFFVQRGVRVKVEFRHRLLVGFVEKVEDIEDEVLAFKSYEIKKIQEVIDEEPLINEELFALAKTMSYDLCTSMIRCFQCMLPAKLKPKSGNTAIKMEAFVQYVKDGEALTKKQSAVLEEMKAMKEMKRALYYAKYKSVGKKLIALGCVEVIEKEAQAWLEESEIKPFSFQLSEEQKQAIALIQKTKGHRVHLLHGATGSGKTEVFLQLAQQAIQEGKQVLILVPEISLTPQMVQRVRHRFGSKVAIYHSGLNDQEKYEQFQLVKKSKVQIVVGTRSAIFMPFEQLGCIILDEEHDASYKQDKAPRYHCRDIAIQRGMTHHCPVVLASATPSLESYARAVKNVYQLVTMPSRINASFPEVKLIEMRQAVKNGESFLLSDMMLKAIAERLEKKEQVILLLNRRGYTPILRCIGCGHVQQCPHCDVAMSFHKEEGCLKCHTCGFSMPVPTHCPTCGSGNSWRYLGIGTQRLEEFVQIKFPDAVIVRMDADTTTKKNAHEQLLSAFYRKEADILIGTQMIAKGLDVEDVTLVGIVNGDAMLNRSDYRSSEATFDLLAQACGRSGRGKKQGEVLIQAYDLHHYALTCAKNHDYLTFFQKEMQYRHLANYPPYTYLASLIFTHEKEAIAMHDAKEALPLCSEKTIKVLGPILLQRIKETYRSRIVLKGKSLELLKSICNQVNEQHYQKKRKSHLEIDLQPLLLE